MRGWTGEDGRLERYNRPHKCVHVRRVYTSEVGFENLLYDFAPHEPHFPGLERAYFAPIDNLAAKARRKLLNDHEREWSSELRSAWSRFLMSLLHRTPAALEVFREGVIRMTIRGSAGVEDLWSRIRNEDDPQSWLEYCLAENPHFLEQRPLELLPRVIENKELGLRLNRMLWAVVRPTYRNWSFLTSDSPLVVSDSLTKPNSHVALALSANALFVAVTAKSTLETIVDMGDRAIFENYNQIVVDRAAKFVASVDQTQDRFIRNNFGRKPVVLISPIFREFYDQAA